MTRLTQRRKLVTRVVNVTPVAASIAALFFVAAGSAVRAEISAYGTALPINLNMARSLDVNAPTDTDDTNIYLRSHQMHSIPEEQIVLTDEAEVRKAGAVLKGDKITYTFSKDEVYAQGNALVARQGTVFEGPELTYRLDAESGSMPNAKFRYLPNNVRGSSDEVQLLGDGNVKMCNAMITTCKEGDNSWWIEASTLDIDQQEETADGRNARLYLGGVPIFASPYFTFPIGEKRKSGFLTPKMGANSTFGFNVEIPYYWNIAPNYDYTMVLKPMSKRGFMLGNQFRYLQPTFGGQLDYDILFHDRETKKKRYSLAWKHTQRLWGGVGLGVNYQRVSDDNYISDFSTNLRQSSEDVLPQNVWLSYGKTYWSTSLGVYKNQTLRPDNEWTEQPYEKIPEFNFRAYGADVKGFSLLSNFTATRFRHGNNFNYRGEPIGRTRSGDGNRVMLNSTISYPMMGSYWFLTPSFEYSMAWYGDITGRKYNSGNVDIYKNSHRTIPIFTLDSGLVFERNTMVLGRETEQTLEPRLYYAYIPYRAQNHLPNFDSSLADLNFAQLFSPNRFIGYDRISNANQLTAALTTRFIDSQTGKDWFSATVGQRYHFTDEKVDIYWNEINRKNLKSDIIGMTEFTLIKDWKAELGVQYSTLWKKFSKTTAGVRYNPAKYSNIGLYYRYNYDPTDTREAFYNSNIKQLDLSFQWPVTRDLYALGHYNYSIRDKKVIDSLIGLEYREGCWIFRSAIQRYVRSAGRTTTNFFFELELVGLGAFGSSPIEALQQSITGYQPLSPRPIEVGRYDYYE